MKKNNKFRIFSFLFCIMIGFLSPITVFSAENNQTNLSYSEYEQYIDDGILGEDVSFEEWQMLVESSINLEESLSNSTDFQEVYSSKDGIIPKASFTPKKGDVIITNGTSSAGILGHAGIATSSTTVFHIAGSDYSPAYISFTNWHTNYTNKKSSSWTKVYRHSSSTVANAAANWAVNTYAGSNADYQITANLASTDVTYCSKLVWQAYYYGPSSHQANGPTIGYRMPYDLPDTIHSLSHKHTY